MNEQKAAIADILSRYFKSWAYKVNKSSVKVFPANIHFVKGLFVQHGIKNIKVIADKTIEKPKK